MDEKDREILRLLQDGFPLDPEPYRVMGDKLWTDEVAVISRIARLIQEGTIRYFGPFFDSRKLGYTGALAAMQVTPEQVDKVAAVMNGMPQITHSYLREGQPNLWFTIITRSEEERQGLLADIRRLTGIDEIKVFPSRRLFKVRVGTE